MSQPSSLDPERRAALLAAKLRALVVAHTGHEGGDTGGHSGAATLARAGQGWFLAHDRPERAVGAAVAWGRQQGLDGLHLVVDDPVAAGVLARRAAFYDPVPSVWFVEGRVLRPAPPAPHAAPVAPPDDATRFVALLADAGVEVVVEHGQVLGEWRGLEIARVVHDPHGARLEVGVGRNDRDAFAMLHGDVPPAEALVRVVDAVRRHRRADGHGHPLTRLAPERWLRWHLLAEPGLVGARSLEPVAPILPRESVRDVVAAGAVGTSLDDEAVVAVSSVGVDLDVVSEAADIRDRWEQATGSVAGLVLVLPTRDALPVVRDLAGALARPAQVVTIPGDWRAVTSDDGSTPGRAP